MKFRVRHETIYTYEAPVTLAPHVLRLRPREDGSQRLATFSVAIDPKPALFADCLDATGNAVRQVRFANAATRLRIESRFEVETLRTNPFDYIHDLDFERVPHRHPQDLTRLLLPYLDSAATDPAVAAFAERLACDVGHRPLEFLNRLNSELHYCIEREIRETGPAQTAPETLALRRGACRDIATLFIESCRAVGLAARFVSGYWKGDQRRPHRHLHAWPEVYIPGGGWRGYDPTHHVAVADEHVAVATAPSQAGTMPVEGGYYGAGIGAKLEFRIEIEAQ